ncbi:MAG: Do family serine endopeptidase [Phycisphaerae bacterium]|nr:Do family serine endopeptidase [Phycisphaerae bacterium]
MRVGRIVSASALGVIAGVVHAASASALMTPAPPQAPVSVDLSTAIQKVAKDVGPAVVKIDVRKVVGGGNRDRWNRNNQDRNQSQRRQPADPNEDFMRRFFGDDMMPFSFGSPSRPREVEGLGSGVIIAPDGFVLTSNHVVSDAVDIEVTLSDGRTLKAHAIGGDSATDIAVIKVDASETLPTAKLGDSDAINVGEWVVAIGTPFGFGQTVTTGIVSAKGRSRVGVAELEDFIQTDAPINPGNSGGPLLNVRGEVIGINAAITTRSGGNLGIAFAVPSKMAQAVMDSIISKGKFERGYLGVTPQDLTEELAREFGYAGSAGALVAGVESGSPADKAGLRQGDIVTEIEGRPVPNANSFRAQIGLTSPGRDVAMTVMREGKPVRVAAQVAARPDAEITDAGAAANGSTTVAPAARLGITVQTVTPDIARDLGDEQAKGVVVTEVERGSVSQMAGIRPGTVVTHVGTKSVSTAREFMDAVAAADLKRGVRLTVRNRGVPQILMLSVR